MKILPRINIFSSIKRDRTKNPLATNDFEKFIETFKKIIGDKGLLIMPTFTYSPFESEVYNINLSKSTVGALTEYFRTRDGVKRSKHPIFSFACWGYNASKFLDFKNYNCFGRESLFGKMYDLNTKYTYNILNKKFKTVFNLFKSIKYISLSNSAGILNNKEFHYNLTRPGIFLYGGYQNKRLKKILKIKPVIKLKAKILQIKEIGANEYIGYNQTYKTKKTIKVAILGIGYGDGIFRILSNKGKVYFKKKSFRIIGRISMDSMTINITNCKHKICVGEYMEIINEDNDIEKIAKECGTISREILTSISRRVIRQYL